MPFNGSGTFAVINTFVPNTTLSSSAVNANYTDIATGLSDCLTRDGQAGMSSALSMGSHLINNVTDPVSAQDAATKNYVDSAAATLWSTGDVKLTFKQVADSGWVLFVDGTIGDATSGATVALATTSALFVLLYGSPFTDSSCPIFTSTGTPTTRAAQGTAAAAYAAHCRLSTPKALGRVLALAGAGSGLTARTMGTTAGAETAALANTNLPPYTPAGTITAITAGINFNQSSVFAATGITTATTNIGPIGSGFNSSQTLTGSTPAFTGNAAGGVSTPFSTMDPATYLNAMVKL
jgi:hypothetical protein